MRSRTRGAAPKEPPKLTYRVGIAMARLARNLIDGRRIAWDELAADLGGAGSVAEAGERLVGKKQKSARRYLATLREEVFIGGDLPLPRLLDREGHDLEPGPNGKIPFDRIREAELVRTREVPLEESDEASPVADVLPQYLAFAILQLLESVLPKKEIQELWERHVGKRESRSARTRRFETSSGSFSRSRSARRSTTETRKTAARSTPSSMRS